MDSNLKLKANLSIKGAKNLPRLGMSSLPSAYVIIKTETTQEATGIYANSCNPNWNYSTEIMSDFQLERIAFYVYNNNPNHIDELLGVGSTEYETFLTPIVTTSKIMLQDATGNYLASWLEIEHCDGNPRPDIGPVMNERTTIRINLLGITGNTEKSTQWVDSYKDKHVTIQYGSQVKDFSENLAVNTFKFDPTQPQIFVSLQLQQKIVLKGSILFGNITKNCSLRVKVYHNRHQVILLIGASIIENGLLPQNHNTLLLQISNIVIEPTKKVPKDWTIVVYGVYGSQLISKVREPCRVYIENNTELEIQYYEENLTEKNQLDFQPIASHFIPVNSINWTTTLNSEQNIKMYNPSRGSVINLDFRFTILKNEKDSGLVPKFQKPNMNSVVEKSLLKVTEIKMSGACFSEVFTDKTQFYFVYIPNFGQKTIFPPFEIKTSIEYAVQCRQTVKDSNAGGQLCLLTYDHYFGKEQQPSNQLSNYIIFKMICKDLQDLSQIPILFQQKFLSFAKKQSLAKNCKKFETMVRDKTLSVKVSGKRYPQFIPGLLTLHNCIMEGGKVRVNLALIFDSNQLRLEGQWNDNLMVKPYTINIRENGVQFKITEAGSTNQVHFQFQQIFGCPEPGVIYSTTIPLPLERKLTIIYSFFAEPQASSPKAALQISRFSATTPVHLKIKSAFVPFQGFKNFHLRVSKSSIVYQTLQENPSSSLIRFRDCQDMYFEHADENAYIFFNLYCRGKEGELVIYAGHYSLKNIIGKGTYQLVLVQMGNEQKKGSSAITFEVLNNPPMQFASIKLSPKQIKFSHSEYLKTIMKYYLVAEINNNPIGIFQLNRLQNTLTTNESIIVRNLDDIVWRLYSSIRQLSKEGFWTSSEKELIATGKQEWTDLEVGGKFVLRFLPPKELSYKLSANKLALLEGMVKILLEYTTQPQPQMQVIAKNKIPKALDIEVLHNGACKLTIWQILPYCSFQKTLQMKLNPLQFDFCSQSRFLLNKEFIVQLENMKMKLGMTKSSKLKEKYIKRAVEKEINFRGKRIKTNERVGFVAEFDGIGLIKADAVILNSKFTSNCRGILKISKIGCQNGRIKQAQIYPLKSQSQLKYNLDSVSPFRLMLTTKQLQLNLEYQTSAITFALYFVLTCQDKTKIKSLLPVAEIPIDKLDDKPFRYEWVVEGAKGRDLMWLEGHYAPSKVEVLAGETVGYRVQGDAGILEVGRQFNTKDKIGLLRQTNMMESFKPDRKRGYRIVARLPQNIEATSVNAVLQNGTTIELQKSQHNLKTYFYTASEAPKIQTLSIECPSIDKIQELEEKNFTRRFLLNRTPSQIVYLQEEPYAIADSAPQTLVINFYFHEIYSKETQGKIMWMENNKNDEILTRSFGILVKHGKQKKVVRGINEKGEFQGHGSEIRDRRVQFGFEAWADELEIFLFISHALNQQQPAQSLQCQSIQNWTKLFPVAYGKINLQKIGDNSFTGCELKKINNFNPTLDKALNNVIIRPNLNCLGSISMEKKRWGYISINLEEVSPIQLEFTSENTLIFFTLQVQNSKRTRIAGTNTEARSFVNRQKLVFSNSAFSFFYIQDKQENESLKIVGTLLTFNNSFTLFQKRVDLSQYLHSPKCHQLVTQIKPSQTKSLKSPLQLSLALSNTPCPASPPSPIPQATLINTVDLVSFQHYGQNQLVHKLLQCQQATHLLQMLEEVKESVLYGRECQLGVLRVCGHYLQFQAHAKLIGLLIDIINIQVCKWPGVFGQLTQADIQVFYKYIKILFQSKELELPKIQKRLSASDYSQASLNPNLDNLDNLVKLQKRRLYTNQQLVQAPSLTHIEPLLPILSALLQECPQFATLFTRDIKQWSECMMYKEDPIFMQYLHMLTDVYGRGQGEMDGELVEDLLRRGLGKNVPMAGLIELWGKLGNDKLGGYVGQMHDKIMGRLDGSKQSQQAVQSLRTFINHLQLHKLQLPAGSWKSTIQRILTLLKSSKDILSINMYGQLLTKINSLQKMQEAHKFDIVGELRKRIAGESDKNVRLGLTNLVDRLVGKKMGPVQEGQTAKNNFYKKYLISS